MHTETAIGLTLPVTDQQSSCNLELWTLDEQPESHFPHSILDIKYQRTSQIEFNLAIKF